MLEDGDLVVFKLYTAYGELCVMGCPLGFVVHVLCLAASRMQLALAAFACCCSMLHQRWQLCSRSFILQFFLLQICYCTCHAETSSLLPNCLNKVLPHVSTVLSAFILLNVQEYSALLYCFEQLSWMVLIRKQITKGLPSMHCHLTCTPTHIQRNKLYKFLQVKVGTTAPGVTGEPGVDS